MVPKEDNPGDGFATSPGLGQAASSSAIRLDDSVSSTNADTNTAAPEIYQTAASPTIAGISCLICLASDVEDQAILPLCRHSLFCFLCIVQWAQVKRTCPLCVQSIGPYILHEVKSDREYKRYYLRPAYDESSADNAGLDAQLVRRSIEAETLRRQRRQLLWSSVHDRRAPPIATREHERRVWTHWSREELQEVRRATDTLEGHLSELERALERRKIVYRDRLYALHLGTNRHTCFRAAPTAASIAQNPQLVATLLPFLQREILALPLGPSVDVQFLTTYIMSVLKSLDVRGDAIARLLDDLFEDRQLAEHFCHEIMTFLRSGAKNCAEFDRRAQYQWPWMTSRGHSLTASRNRQQAQRQNQAAEIEYGSRRTHSADRSFEAADTSLAIRNSERESTVLELESASFQETCGSDFDDSETVSLREEVITRRSKLLARLADERSRDSSQDCNRDEAENFTTPSLIAPPTSIVDSSRGSTPSRVISPALSSSREDLLRRLVHEKRQLQAGMASFGRSTGKHSGDDATSQDARDRGNAKTRSLWERH